MPKDAPAFDFFPQRWLAGTRGLSKVMRADYIDLLCHAWDMDGLPDDLPEIALMLGYVFTTGKRAGEGNPGLIPAKILEKFPVSADGRRRNERMEAVRMSQRRRIAETSYRQTVVAWRKHHKDQPLATHLESLEAFLEHAGKPAMAVPRQNHGSPMGVPQTCQNPATEVPQTSPPITNHPVLSTTTTTRARGCSLDEARAYAVSYSRGNAAGIDIPMQVVTQWHDDRESTGWVTVKAGLELPIADWQADLRKFATHYARNELSTPPPRYPTSAPKPKVQLSTPAKGGW